jgi:DNA polymerase kappa
MESAQSFFLSKEKAGLEGVNFDYVNKIIHEETKNSEFGKNQQRKNEEINRKVIAMKKEIEDYLSKGVGFLQRATDIASQKLTAFETERILTETWLHVDMDMYYASVEIRDNPELADKPIAVGSHNMLTTANYVARKYGVASAMPGFIGLKLCPELIIIPPNFEKYSEVAEQVRNIFKEYDPNFESMGLDEGYLFITPILRQRNIDHEEGRQLIAQEIRDRIYAETSLTASAGIACNKTLAKICSNMNKPNGQFYLPPEKEEILSFVSPLKIRKIPGIGKVLEQMLNGLGVLTCADILEKKVELSFVFTDTTYQFVIKSALGIGPVYHSQLEEQKSCSVSRTFASTDNMGEILDKLRQYSKLLSEELETIDSESRHITVVIKNYKYETKSKGELLKKFVSKPDDIYEAAHRQLVALEIKEPIRLLGIRAGNLAHNKTKRKTIKAYLEKPGKVTRIEEGGEELVKIHKKENVICPSLKKFFKPKQNNPPLQPLAASENTELTQPISSEVIISEDVRLSPIQLDSQLQALSHASSPSPHNSEFPSIIEEDLSFPNENISFPIHLSSAPALEIIQEDDPELEEASPEKPRLKTMKMPCPICARVLETTEYMMNIHIDECISRSQANPNEPAKRKTSTHPPRGRPKKMKLPVKNNLDLFFRK